MGRLWFGNRPVTLLVGDNTVVSIDTELDTTSNNPVINKAIATKLAAIVADNETSKTQIKANTQNISALTTSLANSNSEIDTLSSALESSDSEIEILKTQVAELQSQVQTLISMLNALRSEYDVHISNFNSYQTSTNEQLASLETRLADLESNESYNEGILDDTYTDLEDLFG